MLVPLAEQMVGEVTEYSLIFTARTRDMNTGEARRGWTTVVIPVNAERQLVALGDHIHEGMQGRVPNALAALVAA